MPPDGGDHAPDAAFARPLFLFERLMEARGAACSCVLAIGLDGPVEPAVLRGALDRLVGLHAMLRVAVETRDGAPWFVERPGFRPVPLRIEERVDDAHWRRVLDEEFATPFPPGAVPLLRVAWVRGAARHEFVFTLHHCIGDGLSLLGLLRKTLNLAFRPAVAVAGDAPIRDLAALLPEDHRRTRATRLRAAALEAGSRLLLPATRRLLRAPASLPPNTSRAAWLDRAGTARLRAAARARGVPMFAAVAAAVARAFRAARGGDLRAGAALFAVDVRDRLPGLPRGAMFPLAGTVRVRLPRPGDPWEEAASIAAAVAAEAARLDVAPRLLAGERLHRNADDLLAVVRNGGARHDFVFAYLGTPHLPALGEADDEVAFRGVIGGGASMPWRNSTTVSCVMARGALGAMVCGRPPFLPAAEADAIARAFPEEAARFLARAPATASGVARRQD